MDYEYLKNGLIDFLNDYHKDLYLYKHKISLERRNWVKNAVKKKFFFYDRKGRKFTIKFWERKWVNER